MLLLPQWGARFSDEVTDIFTTAFAARPRDAAGRRGWPAGERAGSAINDANGGHSKQERPNPRLDGFRIAASTVRDATGGIRTRITNGTKEPTPSPPAAPGRDAAGNSMSLFAALRGAAICELHGVRSVIGIRAHAFVPSDRPRALGHAHHLREPRDPGLPFRPIAGTFVGSPVSRFA